MTEPTSTTRTAFDVEEECEMEDHDQAFPRTPALRLPGQDHGSFAICEACMREIFENVTRPQTH